jgi:very-short-patch-repair endonuclease
VENFARVAALAGRQGQMVSREQLLRMGWSDGRIGRARRDGVLQSVLPGVYCVGRPEPGPYGWAWAALLWGGAIAVLSHGWAAWVHRLLPLPEGVPHITTTCTSRHRRPEVRSHQVRSLPEEQVTIRRGLRVTTVARTLLDIAEVEGPERATTALQAAEFHRIVHRPDVEALLDTATGRRGVKPLREALKIPTTRSKLERDFFKLLEQAQLPLPETDKKLHGYRVDFVWPDRRLIVETDGWGSHGTRTGFEDDRRRDARLLARGFATMRITAWRLHREPIAVIAELAAALTGSQ